MPLGHSLSSLSASASGLLVEPASETSTSILVVVLHTRTQTFKLVEMFKALVLLVVVG